MSIFKDTMNIDMSFPPEKPFNNMTKRIMVYNRQPTVKNPERYM